MVCKTGYCFFFNNLQKTNKASNNKFKIQQFNHNVLQQYIFADEDDDKFIIFLKVKKHIM